jgi:hypothetical protein
MVVALSWWHSHSWRWKPPRLYFLNLPADKCTPSFPSNVWHNHSWLCELPKITKLQIVQSDSILLGLAGGEVLSVLGAATARSRCARTAAAGATYRCLLTSYVV